MDDARACAIGEGRRYPGRVNATSHVTQSSPATYRCRKLLFTWFGNFQHTIKHTIPEKKIAFLPPLSTTRGRGAGWLVAFTLPGYRLPSPIAQARASSIHDVVRTPPRCEVQRNPLAEPSEPTASDLLQYSKTTLRNEVFG